MQLIDLFPHLTVKPAPGKPSLISGLSQDSRQIQPGWLFGGGAEPRRNSRAERKENPVSARRGHPYSCR
jgi:hypothetical protein